MLRRKSEAEIELLRKMYPEGTKIVCDYMNDPYNPVPEGTKGEVILIDSIGQIHVIWENGSSLALVPDVDRFHVDK